MVAHLKAERQGERRLSGLWGTVKPVEEESKELMSFHYSDPELYNSSTKSQLSKWPPKRPPKLLSG